VILIDANLLIYAYDRSSPFHEPARRWIERTFSGTEPVRLSWTALLAFVRITTNAKAFTAPLSIEEAVDAVDSWFAQPEVDTLEPGEQHRAILRQLLTEAQVTGPLAMDAHLAALAIEHGATLYTTDGDFELFPGLHFVNPLTRSVT
jgi:uncharacterized protein